jgi:hypothetical protein
VGQREAMDALAGLLDEAYRYELLAASHREFIPDGYATSSVVGHALCAAVASGKAQALREAIDIVSDSLRVGRASP